MLMRVMSQIPGLKHERSGGYRRLSDLAYSKLRYAISEGQISAGSRLVELELCKTLKVGRTPIHDALLRLAGDGLVESVPGAGFFVRNLTLEDIVMAYEIRAALECLALRIAGQHGFSDMKLIELERQCDRMDQANREGDVRGVAEADFLFHQNLIALAGSPQLENAIRGSHLQFLTWSRSMGAEHYLDESRGLGDEHRAIVHQLRARNITEAQRLLGHQIQHGVDRRVREIQSTPQGGSMVRNLKSMGEFLQPGDAHAQP